MVVTLQLGFFLVCCCGIYFYYVTTTLFICSKRYVFHDARITSNYGNCWNVWIVYGSYVIKRLFFHYILFLARQLFDNVDILIMLNLGLLCMFALNMEIMLQSCFIFVHHRGKFFKTSWLHYYLVWYNNKF